MSNLDTMFGRLSSYFSGEHNKPTGVYLSGTIIQLTVDKETIIIGQDTLRFVYSNNEKNAILSFVPCKVSVGSYQRDIDLNISVMSTGLNQSYNRLYIDGGELFQFSTIHDFDFSVMKNIFPKYLELLKIMKTSTVLKGEKLLIDEAIENVAAAAELYNKEA